MEKFTNNENGAITVLIAFGMVAMLGMTALVIDYGRIAREDQRLTKAIDSAVLAGVQELVNPHNSAETNEENAEEIAYDYLEWNGFTSAGVSFSASGREITGEGTKSVNNFFARVLGHETSQIYHRSTARVASTGTTGEGLRPFGVYFGFDDDGDPILPSTTDVILLRAGENTPPGQNKVVESGSIEFGPGNFGTLDLDGHNDLGTKQIIKEVEFGYDGLKSIGEDVSAQPGISQAVMDAIRDYLADDSIEYEEAVFEGVNTKRLWTLPVLDEQVKDVNGASENRQIVGFVTMYIEKIGDGNKAPLEGRFVEYRAVQGRGDEDADDYGTYSISLVE